MIPHLFYYQLAILVLLWLCVMVPYLWSHQCGGAPKRPVDPIMPKPKRSTEPKPFAGLTRKPHCALCEQETVDSAPAPPVRPHPMPPTNRRPREVDTSQHFCPHPGCDYWGWLGLGNLRANGHPNGGIWRQFHCTSCGSYFLETHGTLFHGKRVAVELIVRVLACLAEGLGIRATARVFEVDPNTVLHWLVEAAEQLRAFSRYFLCEVHVRQVQLDELYAVLRQVKDGELSEAEAMERLERSPYWVWTAMDPESKLLLVIDVGTRTLAMAQGALDAFAPVTLRPTGEVVPASARRGGEAPRGVWNHRPGQRSPFGLRLADQHRVCRAPQPRHSSACGGGRAPGQHAVPGRRPFAAPAGAVPDLSQRCVASRQLAP